jgi:hypothetical protein
MYGGVNNMKRFGLFVGVLLFVLVNARVGLAEESGFELPAVTGPYGVGTVSLPLVDGNRPGEYADGRHSPGREMMVQIWYPAQPGVDGSRSVYLDALTAAYALKGIGIPGLDENFRFLIKTHAIVGAKTAVAVSGFRYCYFPQDLRYFTGVIRAFWRT